MIYLLSFNESYINHLTGALLLSTLLSISNVAKGQYNKQQIEQKAELSRLDRDDILDVLDRLHRTGYEDYQKSNLRGNNFLFTTSTDIKFSQSLFLATKDANLKMKYLGISGNQFILRYNERNTWTVVIITEILDENEPILYDSESDKRTIKW